MLDFAGSIAAEPFDSDDARRLIEALDTGLAELYPPEQRFGPNLKAEHLKGGQGVFLIARDDGRAVGCGAIRLLDPTTAEAKRMYVEPDHRGRGVGSAVLAGLEAAAKQLGVRRLVLETGIHQHEALSLYRRAGFTQVDCWGEYASSPTSICLEKQLSWWQTRQRGDGSTAFDDTVNEVSGTRVQSAGGEIVQRVDPNAGEVVATFRDPAGNLIGIYQQPGLAESEVPS